MTRHLHTLKRHASKALHAIYAWCGPVATAVQGEVSKPEWTRAATKAAAACLTSGVTLQATLKDPEVLTMVVVPLGSAVLTGAFDVAFHKQVGDPKPPEAPPAP